MMDVGGYIWVELHPTVDRRVEEKRGSGILHVIAHVEPTETPQGSEAQEFTATCGFKKDSWFSHGMGLMEPHFPDTPPEGIPLCPKCFPDGHA